MTTTTHTNSIITKIPAINASNKMDEILLEHVKFAGSLDEFAKGEITIIFNKGGNNETKR